MRERAGDLTCVVRHLPHHYSVDLAYRDALDKAAQSREGWETVTITGHTVGRTSVCAADHHV